MPSTYPTQPIPPSYASSAGFRRSKSGCGCTGCIVGCLGFIVLCALLCGLGAYVVNRNAPDVIRAVTREILRDANVDEPSRREIMKQVDRVADGYKSGEISLVQLAEIGEKIEKSSLITLVMVKAVQHRYIDRSGLPDDEKQQARIAVSRIARLMQLGELDQQDAESLLDHISDGGPSQRRIRNSLSDQELRDFVAACVTVADKAGIPNEEFEIDPIRELKRILDEVLGATPDTPRETPPGDPHGEPPPDTEPKTPSEPDSAAPADASGEP